jgi:hypothetical protein
LLLDNSHFTTAAKTSDTANVEVEPVVASISSTATDTSPLATAIAPSTTNTRTPPLVESAASTMPSFNSATIGAPNRYPLSTISVHSGVTSCELTGTDTAHSAAQFIQLSDSINDEEEETSVVEVSNSFENDEISNDFILDIELLPSRVCDQRRLEIQMKSNLIDIYSKTSGSTSLQLGEYELTGFHFENGNRAKISSEGSLKLFYCTKWFRSRQECAKTFKFCPYNLFWYEPITAFTMMMDSIVDRVFLAYRPLLDLDCNTTHLIFIYVMYTMCVDPFFSVVCYNKENGMIEIWEGHKGMYYYF